MKNRTQGFTLIELMVTIAVLAILVAIAIPNYQAFVLNSRMTAQANDFLASLNMARSEAVKRNAIVTLSAKGGGWANGWVIYADCNNDGAVSIGTCPDQNGDATLDELLRDHAALEGSSTLVNAGGLNSISFRSNGQVQEGVTTFSLSNPDTSIAPGRDICLNVSGRAQVVSTGACI